MYRKVTGSMDTQYKGVLGELLTAPLLRDLKQHTTSWFFFDVKIPKNDTWVQLDFVLLTDRGHFIIEVKNWYCTVECSVNYYWTLRYGSSDPVVRQNPLFQNEWHRDYMQNLTGSAYENLVVFTDNATLIDAPSNVIKLYDLQNYVLRRPIIYDYDSVKLEAFKVLELKRENSGRG